MNWSDLRDSFRQHVNNRRNESNDSLLLDYYSIRNIMKLKGESLNLIEKFEDLKSDRSKTKVAENKSNNFSALMKFIVSNEEILQSEKWKLEKVYEALDSLKDEMMMSAEETEKIEVLPNESETFN